MTEQQWLSFCKVTDPVLRWLRPKGSERKFRLAGCAAVRHIWAVLPEPLFRDLIEVVERYADGLTSNKGRARAHRRADARTMERFTQCYSEGRRSKTYRILRACYAASYTAMEAGWQAGYSAMVEAARCDGKHADQWAWQSDMLRDLFGNPFRPVTLDPAWRAWHDGTVVKLAEAAYQERELPSGHLEASRLAMVADALEEAGCADEQILAHLRGPGTHVRGCWVVDLLSGKE